MFARIYSPAKSAMQSGSAKAGVWILCYEREHFPSIEPLMGYTSSRDMSSQVVLRFSSRDEAVAFAERNGIMYRLETSNMSVRRKASYSDNFRSDRVQPWTH